MATPIPPRKSTSLTDATSERTVNFHVDRVMRKLNVTTRTQAAITCVRLGLMSA